jgi:phenylalanyl-tRNA synthetase beta chain
VDEIVPYGAGLDDGLVVAEVLQVDRHPDADSLSVCRVATGTGETEVVCGAPNVEAGMKAALAPPGVRLPDGSKLRRRKIRGVTSDGMLCSARELGLGEEADGIIRLPDDAPAGESLGRLLRLPDQVLDINVTPNRGDCFSVRGIAREVAALSGAALKSVVHEKAAESVVADTHAVIVEQPESCPRFAGRVVRGIDVGATSPVWMSERLRRCGIRPIHPVVDVTNYVMLESGQPLHAYDLQRLRGAIRPRFAVAGEKVTLLDEREIELNPDTLVISDDSGAIGLAGIMGGLSTAVTETTTDVFFEAAFWPPEVVAGRARAYGLHTDASLRFERGVDPAGQALAVERATSLLLRIAGGQAGPLVDWQDDTHLPANPWVVLRRGRLARILGTALPDEEVAGILERLALQVEPMTDGWRVRAPGFRFDLQIEEDLVEEVARVYGYDRVPELTATASQPLARASEAVVDTGRLAATLAARDYSEVVTFSFIDAEADRRCTGEESELILSNPLSSEMSVMRASLWPGMLRAAAANLARQQERVRLFEIGTSFHGGLAKPCEVQRLAGLALGPVVPEQWDSKRRLVDFFDIKSDIEALLALSGGAPGTVYEAAAHPALQPGQSARLLRDGTVVGVAGKLHPALAGWLDIDRDVLLFELDLARAFAARLPLAGPLSRFPAVRRDIAVVVDDAVSAEGLTDVVLSAAPDIIRQVLIFDIYRGPGIEAGRKSVALGLILQETSRTLTDHDADTVTRSAVRRLQENFAAVLRE